MTDHFTVEQVKAHLILDPESGKIYWKEREGNPQFNAKYAGKEAFTYTDTHGYKTGQLNSVKMYSHRIIWALHYNEYPDGQIDHINGDRTDNSIDNLRIVTATENMKNISRRKDNKSGANGVGWDKVKGSWRVWIQTHDRRQKHLGNFSDFDMAVATRKKAEAEYGYHANHGRENPNNY